jgi:hypothetical protein
LKIFSRLGANPILFTVVLAVSLFCFISLIVRVTSFFQFWRLEK